MPIVGASLIAEKPTIFRAEVDPRLTELQAERKELTRALNASLDRRREFAAVPEALRTAAAKRTFLAMNVNKWVRKTYELIDQN